jgi:biopolymer transport protein ExbD
MNDNKNARPASGIGVVTLFAVLLILCLTVFAVLTFASAKADLRLSEKNAEMVEADYAADNAAARISADVTAFWERGAQRPGARAIAELEEKIAAYDGAEITHVAVEDDGDGGLTVSYGVCMGELLTLEVSLSLPRGGVCEVLAWRSAATDEADFEEEILPVWEG